MKKITGLTDGEQMLVERLTRQLMLKRVRNSLRSAYMDGKHVLHRLPPTAPPYLRDLAVVLGWPAKAVELLARRIRLNGFASTSGDFAMSGVPELLEANAYYAMTGQAQVSALVHSCVFQTVTRGDSSSGEPGVLVSQVSALDGTGVWDYRRRCLSSFLAVSRWPQPSMSGHVEGLERGSFTLYTPGMIATVDDGKVVARDNSLPVSMPVTVLPYKPRLDRPFGSSRISRTVMSLTDSAVRTVLRSEGTADFYGAPWFMIFGPDESAFQKGAWQMIMDRVNAIPDNTNPDVTHQRADVKQFSQASQQPHVDQLQVLAGLFAGETSIPVSSLGVGLSQANPTSAESYLASREDLIAEAEDAQASWARAHCQTVRWVWQIANNEKQVSQEIAGVMPVWRDTRFTSRASAADAVVKLVSVFPWMAESDAVIEQLGFDVVTTRRMLAEKRRGTGSQSLLSLVAEAQEATNTAGASESPLGAVGSPGVSV